MASNTMYKGFIEYENIVFLTECHAKIHNN